jgi:hypothetical protein
MLSDADSRSGDVAIAPAKPIDERIQCHVALPL